MRVAVPTTPPACLVVLVMLLAGPGQGRAGELREREVQQLLERLETDAPATREIVAGRLAALGPQALPALLQAYVVAPPEALAARASLARAIGMHDPEAVVGALEAWVAACGDDDGRMKALELLATFGDDRAVSSAVDLVAALPPAWLHAPSVVRTWEAVLATLADDRLGRMVLLRTLPQIPEDLRTPTVSFLARWGSGRDLGCCLEALRQGDPTTARVLLALREASPVALAALDLPSRLRWHLRDREPSVRAAAVALLGRLGTSDVFADVVGLLEDHSPRIRRAAHEVLRRMSGLALPPDPSLWNRWYQSESAALQQSRLAARLKAGSPAALAGALRETALRRLLDASTVESVGALVHHDTPGIRLLACATLYRMGRPEAAPALVAALSDEDETVRHAAWEALRRLSDEDYPLDTSVWSQAVARWTEL